jgi:probable HAF family extracellular repeat protein
MFRYSAMVLSVFCLVFSDVRAVSAAVQYTLTDLNGLPGYTYGSNAVSINASGQVVGIAWPGIQTYHHGFLYSNGTITDIGTLPSGVESVPTGINSLAQVTGRCEIISGGYVYVHAFLYSQGVMTALNASSTWSYGNAINDSGQVAGSCFIGSRELAVLFSGGKMINLGTLPGYPDLSRATAIDNNGRVVGYSVDENGLQTYSHAFLYSNGAMTDLGTIPGDIGSAALGINGSGQVVGTVTLPNWHRHAFMSTNGIMADLGTLPGYDWGSEADAINANGQVVGNSEGLNNQFHAFLYADGTMKDLNNLIAPGSGWTLEYANAINDSGQIVGSMYNANGVEHAFLLTPIPEPSALVLLGIGAISLLGYAWRRQRHEA